MHIALNKDRQLVIEFDGDLTFLMAIPDLRTGKLDSNDPEFLEIVDELKEDASFRSVSYEGDAVYAVEYRHQAVFDGSYYFLGGSESAFFHITSHRDNCRIEISSVEIEASMRNDLLMAGLSSRGTVQVSTNAKVVEHNAQSEPGLFSGTYRWELDGLDDGRAYIVLDI